MHVDAQHSQLIELIKWIDEHTSGLSLPADDRSLLAVGCFDVALEHQGAIALLFSAELYGSAFALLRVLAESLVRGLWLLHCATDIEMNKFKNGKLDKKFDQLVKEFEAKIGTPDGVLSSFKKTAWSALNGFTHTGFHQVSRRHANARVEGNYPEHELANALGVAGALGLIAGGQVIAMSERADLLPLFNARMESYAKNAP
jgi:hypothetical protein